jgi:hypothetical protein
MLRDYCEELSSGRHAAAARALSDAARMLGVVHVEGYISRGAKAIGLRAYEDEPGFVLIGGRHLDREDAYAMSEAELRFAIAAEVAHLRYGHTRVTSSEVWAGALNKSRQGLDLALGVIPALRGFHFAERLHRLTSKLPPETLRGLLGSIAESAEFLAGLGNSAARSGQAVLSRVDEELVAAHRVVQLTADRAGLVLSGNLRAALRAMILVRSDYGELALAMSKDGLDALLSQRAADGRIAHQGLAVRVAALLGFYLSEEYELLRAELGQSAD